MPFDKDKWVFAVIAVFLFVKLFSIGIYTQVWWDSAIYIGMGKHIFSFGNAGLWEDSRPIVWPLMLGFLWKTGLNPVLYGRVLEITFGSLCILLTYFIGKKLFNQKIAMLSSMLLAFSPTFFFFNGVMLTEVTSTFFSLIALYIFIEKKHFISGLFFGIAFLARFLQLFVFIATFLTIFTYFNNKNIKNQTKLLMGFIAAITPFFILNQILYGNALFPFLQQIFLSNNSGWFNYHPLNYYFIELFKESFLYLFSIFGILLLFRNKEANKKVVVITFLLFFIFFNSIKQKEMRFLIILLPYIYLLISYAVIYLIDKFKNNSLKNIIFLIIGVSFIFSIFNAAAYYKNESNKDNQYEYLQSKFQEHDIKGKIWVSNPIIPVLSDKKTDQLMYYPAFNDEKKKELIENADEAGTILMDSCDLACKPDDLACQNSKKELLLFFKQKFKIKHVPVTNQCEQYIFEK